VIKITRGPHEPALFTWQRKWLFCKNITLMIFSICRYCELQTLGSLLNAFNKSLMFTITKKLSKTVKCLKPEYPKYQTFFLLIIITQNTLDIKHLILIFKFPCVIMAKIPSVYWSLGIKKIVCFVLDRFVKCICETQLVKISKIKYVVLSVHVFFFLWSSIDVLCFNLKIIKKKYLHESESVIKITRGPHEPALFTWQRKWLFCKNITRKRRFRLDQPWGEVSWGTKGGK
jgi:hypothetical protein